MNKIYSVIVLLILSNIIIAQTKIISKDIADVVLPNPEVELFYGDAQNSVDNLIFLQKYIVFYDAFKSTFFLLDKENRLLLDKLSMLDIKHIKTKTENVVYYYKNQYKKAYSYKAPFVQYSYLNKINMHSISDTSIYVGLIKIKENYKIVKLFVKNDKIKIQFENYEIKDSYIHLLGEKQKIQKTITKDIYDYNEINGYQIISLRNSPVINKKKVSWDLNGLKLKRDSIYSCNAVYYKKKENLNFQLLREDKVEHLYKKFRYFNDVNYFWHSVYISNNNLIYYEVTTDSIIIFDKELQKVYANKLAIEIKKYFKNIADIDTSMKLYKGWEKSVDIIKDEFTQKLYVKFKSTKEGHIISELNVDYINNKINFKFLRNFRIMNAKAENISINKGIMFITILNQLTNTNYVYKYDLYKGLINKDDLLDIRFAKLSSDNKKNKYKINGNLKHMSYNKLSKKQVKIYFGKIKKDTVSYNQNSHKEVLKSIIKSIENDSITYAMSQLQVYNSNLMQVIKDDIEYKEYNFFNSILKQYNKEKALLLYKDLLANFDVSEKELYSNKKLLIKTPNNGFYYMYKINDLWYMSATVTTIYYN